jgi:Uma2 family endonuclease
MEVTSTEIQNNFGTYLNLLDFEDVIITRNSKKIAVLKKFRREDITPYMIADNAAVYRKEHRKMTYEEFIKMSDSSDNRYEFIDGEVYLMSSPSYMYQKAVGVIMSTMYVWFRGKKCRPLTSPFDVTLTRDDEKNVVQPDILVICDTENINEKGRYTGVPTLVVEVLSETTKKLDMLKKLDLYSESGIKEYWVVNPFNKEIYVYSFTEYSIEDSSVFKGAESVKSIVFEGLEVSLEEIFAM